MSASFDTLEPGDIVEIKYRLWRPTDSRSQDVVEKWIGAHVIACEQDTWPLARLTDGQVTEIRPFMTWRIVTRSARRSAISVAA
jgi:hypothetical protein